MAQRAAPVALFPFSIVRAIAKRWKLSLIVWVILSVAGLLVLYRFPDVYKSESTILVEQQKIPEQLVASTVQVELQDRLATLTQQILSATQLQKVIEKHKLYADSPTKGNQEEIVERMRSDIEVKVEKGWSRQKPGAFRIAYKSSDPQLSATITNELASLFIDKNIEAREVQASGTSEFLNAQLEDSRKRLLEQEAKLAEFKQKNTGQLPGQENALLMALTQLQTQATSNNDSLNRAQSASEMMDSEIRSAENGLQRLIAVSSESAPSPEPTPSTVATTIGLDPGSGSLPPVKHSVQLQNTLDQLLQRYTEQHPQVRAVKAELERQKAQEAREALEASTAKLAKAAANAKTQIAAAGQVVPPPTVRMNPQAAVLIEQQKDRLEHLKAQQATIKLEIQNRVAERDRINAELNGHQGRLEKLPLREQEMIAVTRDYEISKRTYEGLLGKSFTANTAEDMEKRQKAERFAILDIGRVPEKPYSPNRQVIYPAIVVVSLLVALFWSVFAESRRNVVLGEWELPKDVWLLARVPKVDLAASPIPAIVGEGQPPRNV